MNHRQRSLTENNLLHTSNYTNETFPLRKLSDDQFYVLPREHIRKEIDFNSKTLENTVDAQEIYAVPSNFSQNFVLESNVSFDDSEELSSVCLDSVPELISSESNSHEIYYSHPEQRTRSVRKCSEIFTFFLSDGLSQKNKNRRKKTLFWVGWMIRDIPVLLSSFFLPRSCFFFTLVYVFCSVSCTKKIVVESNEFPSNRSIQ